MNTARSKNSQATRNHVALKRLVRPRCEWFIGKGQDFTQCGNPAKWRKGNWDLCDHHKQRLIEGYSDTWASKETPEWMRI